MAPIGPIISIFRAPAAVDQALHLLVKAGSRLFEVSLVLSQRTSARLLDAASDADAGSARQRAAGRADRASGLLVATLTATERRVSVPELGLIVLGPAADLINQHLAVNPHVGLLGVMIDWGVPDRLLRDYEVAINAGAILLGVEPRGAGHAARIRIDWKGLQGEGIFHRQWPGSLVEIA